MNAPEIVPSHTASVLCDYHPLEGNIHEFVFRENSREAIDEWLHLAEGLIPKDKPIPSFNQLIDITFINDPPIVYVFNQVKLLNAQYSNVKYWHTAVIHPQGTLIFVANTFINMLRIPMAVKFFQRNERDKAIQWLRAHPH